MTHISKKKLSTKATDDIHSQFLRIIIKLKGNKGVGVIEELFTKTEQVMFAKRLAAILMLTQDISPFHVSEILNISSSTSMRLSNNLTNGRYSHIETIVSTKKGSEQLWKDLEVLIRFGMPSMGKNRWKWLNEIYKD